MAIEKSLVSGSMTMLILKLLSEKDMYGYEMIGHSTSKSQNVFEMKAGTLYPLLHSLEDKRTTHRIRTGRLVGRRENIIHLPKMVKDSWKRKPQNGKNMQPQLNMYLHWRYNLWMNI